MSDDHADKSFWLAAYGPYAENRPLEAVIDVDVAVVGGGFTGLSTAWHLRCAEPGASVAVLESEIVGYGASGRNAGFSMTLFGLEAGVTKALFGAQRTVEAYRYMERAVDYVDRLVREHGIRSDYEFPGYLRVATSEGAARRIERDLELLTRLGIAGLEWMDAPRLRAEVDSPAFLGGVWEPRCGLLDPARQVRELKRLAEAAGARVFERTPVTSIHRGERLRLTTPRGTVTARKLVLATNAYSHLLPWLRRKQVPVFTHMVVTEPLSAERRARIGWRNRQGVEDGRALIHYLRLTADDRIAIGGSDVSIPYGSDMDCDASPRVFADLERAIVGFFPALGGIRCTHRWGGPVSVPVQMVPALGYLGDPRVTYSLGCMGHGVSLSHLNGQTLADLVLERRTELTEVWFVNRRVVPWPPEPLRFAVGRAVRGALRLLDARDERRPRPAALPEALAAAPPGAPASMLASAPPAPVPAEAAEGAAASPGPG